MANPRRAALVSGLMAASAGAALASARRFYRASLPVHDGRAGLPGLHGPVEVVRDIHGVPHIRALTFGDAIAAQGFCHAQDRLWQMELVRRLVRGRLAEIVGPPGLDSDRLLRTLGLAEVADREADALDDADRAFVDAYCGGINGYLTSPRFRPPFELRLLKAGTIEPWSAGDALLSPRLLALILGQNWELELVRERLRRTLGPDRCALLEPALGPVPGGGSNAWAVAGSRTASGQPLLANDTHLQLALPCAWYVTDLAWADGRAAGFGFAGSPGVMIGRTATVAWGLVNAEADTQDLIVVPEAEPVTTREESIAVRGRRRPHVEQVQHTRLGPVVTPLIEGEQRNLALAWTGLDPAGNVGTLRRLLVAERGEDVVSASAGVGGVVLELVWADREGHIGRRMIGGPIPIRGSGRGLVPVDGSDPSAGFTGAVPYDDLPDRRDPDDGLLVAANDASAVPEGYRHHVSSEFLPPYRAERIRELLEAAGTVTLEDCLAAQLDVHSAPGLALQALVRDFEVDGALAAAHAAFLAWDGELAADSPGAAVYGVLLRHLTRAAFREAGDDLDGIFATDGFSELTLNPGLFGRATPVLLELLEGGDGFFENGATWPDLYRESLGAAVAELTERLGPDPVRWRWGDVHRVVLDHPLGRLPGLARIFRRGPYPLGGDGDTVAQAWQPLSDPISGLGTVGAAMRFATDLADPDSTRFVLCGGQSGHPASDAYDDQLVDWLLGRSRPLAWSRDAIDRDRANTLWLDPPGV